MADTEKEEYWGRNAYGGYGDARDPSKRSGMSDETNRYQQMANVDRAKGQQAADRGAYGANYDVYNEGVAQSDLARGRQVDALDMQRARAAGQGQSAAEIAGRNAMEASLNSQVAAAGAARGGAGAQAAAMRNAAQQNAVAQQQMTQNIQAGRAAEIAQAQDAYAGTATNIRGQDFGRANLGLQRSGQELQNEQFQRGLNQQGQFGWEGLGMQNEAMRQNVFHDQLVANQNAQQESDAAWNAGRGSKMQDEGFGWSKFKDITGMATGAASGAVGGAIASDEQMKTGIMPVGSLAGLGIGSIKAGSSTNASQPGESIGMVLGSSAKGQGMDVMGSLKKTNEIDTHYLRNPGASPTSYSDERTKTAVHDVGFARGYAAHAADADASKAVNARRASGGYAQLDMSPIPYNPSDRGYQGRDADAATARLHGAIESETAGAEPYYSAPREVKSDNAAEADKIRANFAPSIGETAQKTADDKKKSRGFGDILLGALGGLGGIGAKRDVSTSDERAKEAAGRAGYLLGRAHENEALRSGERVPFAYGGPPRAGEDIIDQDPTQTAPSRVMGRAARSSKPVKDKAAQQEEAALLEARRDYVDQQTADQIRGAAMLQTGNGLGLLPLATGAINTKRAYDTMKAEADEKKLEDSVVPLEPGQDVATRSVPMQKEPAGRFKSAARRVSEKANEYVDKARSTIRSDERTKEVLKQEAPLAEAARSQEASAYRYKPSYTPPGQKQGEVNVGPMAQSMAADPVARTTIVKGDDGMLMIDKEKLLKLLAGEVSSQQRQIDALASKKRRAA